MLSAQQTSTSEPSSNPEILPLQETYSMSHITPNQNASAFYNSRSHHIFSCFKQSSEPVNSLKAPLDSKKEEQSSKEKVMKNAVKFSEKMNKLMFLSRLEGRFEKFHMMYDEDKIEDPKFMADLFKLFEKFNIFFPKETFKELSYQIGKTFKKKPKKIQKVETTVEEKKETILSPTKEDFFELGKRKVNTTQDYIFSQAIELSRAENKTAEFLESFCKLSPLIKNFYTILKKISFKQAELFETCEAIIKSFDELKNFQNQLNVAYFAVADLFAGTLSVFTKPEREYTKTADLFWIAFFIRYVSLEHPGFEEFIIHFILRNIPILSGEEFKKPNKDSDNKEFLKFVGFKATLFGVHFEEQVSKFMARNSKACRLFFLICLMDLKKAAADPSNPPLASNAQTKAIMDRINKSNSELKYLWIVKNVYQNLLKDENPQAIALPILMGLYETCAFLQGLLIIANPKQMGQEICDKILPGIEKNIDKMTLQNVKYLSELCKIFYGKWKTVNEKGFSEDYRSYFDKFELPIEK